MEIKIDLFSPTHAKKVAIIGPESTGKTVLLKELVQFYDCNFVLEHARQYVESLKRRYGYDDIMVISRKQRELEKAAYKKSKKLLICDSAMITNKVWSYDKFDAALVSDEKYLFKSIYANKTFYIVKTRHNSRKLLG